MIHIIAGHTFPDFGACQCGVHWLDIRQTHRGQVGDPHIAHTAHLTVTEYEQIEAARIAEDARIEEATSNLSGGTG